MSDTVVVLSLSSWSYVGVYKKLSCRRDTARRSMSCKFCRLYDGYIQKIHTVVALLELVSPTETETLSL